MLTIESNSVMRGRISVFYLFRMKDRSRRLGAFAPRRDSQASIEEDVPFSLYVELANQNDTDLQFPYYSPPTSVSDLS